MLSMGLPSSAPDMPPPDSTTENRPPSPLESPLDVPDFDALPPPPAPRGLMKPKLKIYHWLLIALLLGGLVALFLVGVAAD